MPTVDPERAAQAHAIDLHVAGRIRALREKRELTCVEVGRHLNVTGEQVRKYESGANRITAGKLAQLARLFKVRIDSLYQGVPGH
jgi:transcriptional regulator with XRE-family HTH domain